MRSLTYEEFVDTNALERQAVLALENLESNQALEEADATNARLLQDTLALLDLFPERKTLRSSSRILNSRMAQRH